MSELHSFGSCLRQLLQNKGMKAEKLVLLMNATGSVITNKPAISRIMTGKRLPTTEEMRVIAEIIEEPLLYHAHDLLNAYTKTKDDTTLLAFYETIDQINNRETSDTKQNFDIHFALLYQMLKNLYQNCLTYDVSAQIKEGFWNKLYEVTGLAEMVNRLRAMYHCYIQNVNLTKTDRAWLGAALLYFITPIDFIPDYILPYGYMDDAIVVGFVFSKLQTILNPFLHQMEDVTQNSKIQ